MKPAPFAYTRPGSVAGACAVLAAEGEDARVLAGGQSLVAMLNLRLARPSLIVDVNRIADLARIEERGGTLVTGATVRQADAMADARIKAKAPLLALALPHVGHAQTRSRGTIGGSVAHADPSAEIPLALTVAGGSVALVSRSGRRLVPAADFMVGPMTTSRRSDELVEALHWPLPPAGARLGFVEHALRGGDFALAAVAVMAVCAVDGGLSELRIGLGGVGDCVALIDTRPFIGRRADAEVRAGIAEAAGKVEARSDAHANFAYRQMLARSLTLRALDQALGELS